MPQINDKTAAFGLFIVALTAWGHSIYGSQAYMMNVVCLAALSFLSGNVFIKMFGCYCSAWFAYMYAAEYLGWMPGGAMIQAIDSLTLIMSGIGLYSIIKNGSSSKAFWMNCICIISVILSIIGLLQFYFVRVSSATLGCSNFLAAFLAISSFCFFRRKWCLLLIPVIACIGTAQTSAAFAAVFVGTGFFFWKWRGVLLAIIPGLIYFHFIDGHSFGYCKRYGMWMDATEKILNSWQTTAFGVGPGIFCKSSGMLHSEYFYTLWNFGIVGVILTGLYIVTRKATDRIFYAAFLAVLVDGIANHVLHTAPTAFLAVVIFALNDRGSKCL